MRAAWSAFAHRESERLTVRWARVRSRQWPAPRIGTPRALLAAQGGALARTGQDPRRGGKAGVRIHDPKLFFCIRLVMEAFTDGQPSLLLRVPGEREPGLVDVLACHAK
jgi:hypothetical protein